MEVIVLVGVVVISEDAVALVICAVADIVLVSAVVVEVAAVGVGFAVVSVNVVLSGLADKVNVVIVDPVETVVLPAKV